jgi:hypothetical protein
VITNQLETLSSQGGNQFAKADAGLRRYRMVIGIYADNSAARAATSSPRRTPASVVTVWL